MERAGGALEPSGDGADNALGAILAAAHAAMREGTWERVLDSAEDRWGGPGTVTPCELVARSEVRLTLPPMGVVAYALRVDPMTYR